jgi:hypothetical protein
VSAASDARPGEELVTAGLADIAGNRETVAALLVRIGGPRLRRLGVAVPPEDAGAPSPEHRLYALLAREHGHGAHARYNALVRRLVSFEHALERERGRARRLGGAA